MTDKKLTSPMLCSHCGNETIFEIQGSYQDEFYDEILEITGAVQWVLYQCKTCQKATLQKGWISSDQLSFARGSDGEIEGYWTWEKLYPIKSNAPLPSLDMPKDLISDYNEAKNVLPYSPRSSAALLRLVLQKLCKYLGQPGKNINDDIKALVKNGLTPIVQKALDSVRVIGNNAVHPGEINLDDNPQIALSLFKVINFIIDETITRPREIQELYDNLPETHRESIDKRDGRSN